jgi:Asp-tRNA(Asn)/Glu-tRNA(Gln) amidotransferase C subunit
LQKLWSYVKGIPGLLGAIVVLVVAFQLYIHAREKAAVERAHWKATVDSLAAARRADSTAAALRDSARVDSIANFRHLADAARSAATQAGRRAAGASTLLHQLVDSNAAARAALDSLEAEHASTVTSLQKALAYADSIHAIDSLRIADRDQQIAHLRKDVVDMTAQANKWESRAHPGFLAGVFRSPWTHAAAAGLGYVLGRR